MGLDWPSYEVLEVEVAVGEIWVCEPLVLPRPLRLRFLTGSGSFRMSLSKREICTTLAWDSSHNY
jgi:hypothetical protein